MKMITCSYIEEIINLHSIIFVICMNIYHEKYSTSA